MGPTTTACPNSEISPNYRFSIYSLEPPPHSHLYFSWPSPSSPDVNRVDVSLDGGKNFTRADLLPAPIAQRRGSKWGWTFFEREIPLPAELIAKAKQGKTFELELTSKVSRGGAAHKFHTSVASCVINQSKTSSILNFY